MFGYTVHNGIIEFDFEEMEKTTTPQELKEQRLRELLREFEEILNMNDEECEEYNRDSQNPGE